MYTFAIILCGAALYGCKKSKTTPVPIPKPEPAALKHTAEMGGPYVFTGTEQRNIPPGPSVHDTAFQLQLSIKITPVNDSSITVVAIDTSHTPDPGKSWYFLQYQYISIPRFNYLSSDDSTITYIDTFDQYSNYGFSLAVADSMTYNYITRTITEIQRGAREPGQWRIFLHTP